MIQKLNFHFLDPDVKMPKSSRCSDFQTDHIFARFLLPAFESYRLSDDALWNIGEQFNSQVCRQFRKSSPDQIIEISGMPTDSILLYSRILDDLKASHPEYKQILSYSMKLLIHEHTLVWYISVFWDIFCTVFVFCLCFNHSKNSRDKSLYFWIEIFRFPWSFYSHEVRLSHSLAQHNQPLNSFTLN